MDVQSPCGGLEETWERTEIVACIIGRTDGGNGGERHEASIVSRHQHLIYYIPGGAG